MFKLCNKFTSNKIKLWEIYICIYSNDLVDDVILVIVSVRLLILKYYYLVNHVKCIVPSHIMRLAIVMKKEWLNDLHCISFLVKFRNAVTSCLVEL